MTDRQTERERERERWRGSGEKGGVGGRDCFENAETEMGSVERNAEVAAVLRSELEAADDLLRIFANGHEDEKVREHINTHLRAVRGEDEALARTLVAMRQGSAFWIRASEAAESAACKEIACCEIQSGT